MKFRFKLLPLVYLILLSIFSGLLIVPIFFVGLIFERSLSAWLIKLIEYEYVSLISSFTVIILFIFITVLVLYLATKLAKIIISKKKKIDYSELARYAVFYLALISLVKVLLSFLIPANGTLSIILKAMDIFFIGALPLPPYNIENLISFLNVVIGFILFILLYFFTRYDAFSFLNKVSAILKKSIFFGFALGLLIYFFILFSYGLKGGSENMAMFFGFGGYLMAIPTISLVTIFSSFITYIVLKQNSKKK